MIIPFLKAAVFLLSFVGCVTFFREKLRLPVCLVPAAVISCDILILYVSSLAGLLRWGALFLTLAGCALFVLTLLRKPKSFAVLLTPQIIFFALFAAVILLYNLRYRYSIAFDNYSHWALIAKLLYQTDALPVPGSVVTFSNYPPAAGLWIYYVMKNSLMHEWIMAGAQGALIAACFTPLFADFRWKNPLRLTFSLLSSLALVFLMRENLWSLQVDALLSYLAILAACTLLLPLLRKNPEDNAAIPLQNAVLCGLFCSVLALTKLSGLILCVSLFILGLILWIRPHAPENRRNFLSLALSSVVTPVIFSLSYRLRTVLVYGSSSGGSQFDASLSGIRTGIEKKSGGFFTAFTEMFLRKFGDLQTPVCLALLLVAAGTLLAVLLCLILRKKPFPPTVRMGIFAYIFLAAYTVTVYLMYVFMMPENESLALASFDRYIATGMIFTVFLLLAVPLLRTRTEKIRIDSCRLILLALLPCLTVSSCYAAIEPKWLMTTISVRADAMNDIASVSDKVSEKIAGDNRLIYVITLGLKGYVPVFCKYIFMENSFVSLFSADGKGIPRPKSGVSSWLLYLSGDKLQNALFCELTGLSSPRRGLYEGSPENGYALSVAL